MAKKEKERSSAPKLGAQYQAAKLGVQLAGPPVIHAFTNPKHEIAAIKNLVKSPGYLKSVAVALADQWGSKKLGHAAALSRHSVTALIPEVLAVGDSATRADIDPQHSVQNFVSATDGLDTDTSTFSFNERIKTYGFTKYGLGIGRKVLNKTRLAEPLKKALSMLGVTL